MPKLSARTQHASLYTRRFNALKRSILKDLSPENSADDTVAIRFSEESCIIAHDGDYGFSIHFYDDHGEFIQTVQIVRARAAYYSLRGIHSYEVTTDRLWSLIDEALKDGFDSIYVHSIDSTKAV